MGKSTVAQMLRDLGIPVFDADAEVRAMQGPGGELLPAIEQAFPGTTGPEGLNRPALRAAVFDDKAALARLEAIVHPAVASRRAAFLRANAGQPLIVYDIPLLFEKGSEGEVHATAVVSAPAHLQAERVLARPGMDAATFARILAHQMPDADKRARADVIIDTGTDHATTQAAVAHLVARIRAGDPPPWNAAEKA